MPNIFKRFSSLIQAEPYQFPKAEELSDWLDPPPEEEAEEEITPEEELFDEVPEDDEPAQAEETFSQPEEEPPREDPIAFAQVQADAILRDARVQAEKLLEQARREAEEQAEQIREDARAEGQKEGYADGLLQGRQEAERVLAAQGKAQAEEVQKYLVQAGEALDRKLDGCVEELRDLAMAIAEKVICVSLKSSSDVICRMIQTAIDKKKRREWVHIYIAECDAKRLGQLPASLSNALSALSGRVRIIPIAEDEPGTCIIEMPDEIIDASTNTQLNNIRSLLMDATSGGSGI